jgi:hypothetical protein
MQLIEDAKKKLGFTDDIELARHMGKDKSTVSKWRAAGKIPAQAEKERMKYYYAGPDSYVFPSYGKTGHITDASSALEAVAMSTGIKSTHQDLRRSFISYCEELEIGIFSRKRLANHAIPLDVTEGYTQFSMEKLRVIIEKIASYILSQAGIPYQAAPVHVVDMNLLSDEQREAVLAILGPKEPAKVISMEEVKTRRRMASGAPSLGRRVN